MISAQITEAQRLAPKWDVAHPVHEPPFPLNRTALSGGLDISLFEKPLIDRYVSLTVTAVVVGVAAVGHSTVSVEHMPVSGTPRNHIS